MILEVLGDCAELFPCYNQEDEACFDDVNTDWVPLTDCMYMTVEELDSYVETFFNEDP